MSNHYEQIKGVLHVGANSGQERDLYAQYDLSVLWFEPNPEIFTQLQMNLINYPKQKAYRYAVTDKDDATYIFNISSHKTDPNQVGQSSSIFELYRHKEIWPDVFFSRTVEVTSITLDTFMKRTKHNPSDYQKLHVDVQGADLLVLKGAVETLRYIKFLQIETSSMELYKGACLESEIDDFLSVRGFAKISRGIFIDTPEGICTENIYEKIA